MHKDANSTNLSHLTGNGETRGVDETPEHCHSWAIRAPGSMVPTCYGTCHTLHYCIISRKCLNKIMCCIKYVKLMFLEQGVPI